MEKTIHRTRKSQLLTNDEMKALKNFIKGFRTKIEAYEALDIAGQNVENIILRGTAKPDTIAKINAAIAAKSQTH